MTLGCRSRATLVKTKYEHFRVSLPIIGDTPPFPRGVAKLMNPSDTRGTRHPSGPPEWAQDALRPKLGRFLLGPELGRGGMGHVHAGWDPLLRRQVALKLLHQGDPLQLLRFMREAQIQAKVEHPQVCKVYEVDSDGDQPYIAMQFIQGRTLGEAREDLDLREAARIMAEVAGAIHAAHRLGLVHRDLKPSNILLEDQEEGRPKPFVLDFGLARDQSIADQSLSWGMVGTPAFMSPEQARAEELTPASDIYSLGATFYALFAGRPPFEATSLVGLAEQQDNLTVRSLRREDPAFPADLDTILRKCLDPEPRGRYASAWALQEDLQRWLAGEPIQARPLSPMALAWRRIQQRRTLSLTIAASLLVTASLVAWNFAAGQRARLQVQLAQTFALQVREVEQLLRIERMLPPHDIRPAEAKVRSRMAEIRQSMARLGTVAAGPGHYALGRGYLALRDHETAAQELEAAWAAGFRTPEVAYARGAALLDRFLMEQERLHETNPIRMEAALAPLRVRFVAPALAHFKLAQGHIQGHPAYGEAQVAMLQGDYEHCIEKCREAFAAEPWMHEAKLLEARALRNTVYGKPGYNGPLAEVETRLQEARQAVQVAAGIAHSDEAVLKTELALLTSLTYHQADNGTPSAEPFERSEVLFAQALLLRPADADLIDLWLHGRIRQGFFLLDQGRDARPLMRDAIQRTQTRGGQLQAGVRPDAVAHLHTILAEAQWRYGENPLPALAEADRLFLPGEFGHTQTLRTRADVLLTLGENPSATLEEGERLLNSEAVQAGWSFWHESVYGMYLLARADWAWRQGQDPGPHLDQALLHAERSRSMSPDAVYAHYLLIQGHTFRARRALALGKDPQADLSAAEQAGKAALRLTANHFRVHLALANLHCTRALALLERGDDPAPALEQARQSVAAGLRRNGTDFRLHLAAARTEVLAATAEARQGRPPLAALERAEKAARTGLATKGDAAQLWTLLAQVERLRAEWEQAHPNTLRSGRIEAGLGAIARALRANPSLPEAKAEQALLAPLGSRARATLASLALQNPFLAWEYRDHLPLGR